MKEIQLTRGLVALVDDADYEALAAHKWHADRQGYAARNIPHPHKPGKQTIEMMHRRIFGLAFKDGREVDHDDLNRLNNRRYNLREATRSQNNTNKGLASSNTSGFKGVTLHDEKGKWRARICASGERVDLGLHPTKEAAHEAYKAAASKLHGEFANHG